LYILIWALFNFGAKTNFFINNEVKIMQYRSTKIPANLDAMGSIAGSLVMQATGKQLVVLSGQTLTGNGHAGATFAGVPLMAIPKSVGARWRVVGVGAYVYTDAASTVAESFTWGHLIGDLGADDIDAFGSFVMDETADKQIVGGDFIYAGIAPVDDFFEFDALANAGTHVWDISGAGAGVQMGTWQTKSAWLVMLKVHVVNSTATGVPLFLVEIETGGGIT
jgi:hypothetical protein